jgi:hypothetical protein
MKKVKKKLVFGITGLKEWRLKSEMNKNVNVY